MCDPGIGPPAVLYAKPTLDAQRHFRRDGRPPIQHPRQGDTRHAKLCGGIWGFGIFDNGDEAKIEAAKTFIDFIAADPDQVRDSVLASTYFPVRTSVGDIYADNEVMSEYSKFMGYLGDYYPITPGWTTARTEWWNMLQRVGSGEAVETAVATFVENANAAAAAEA